MELNLSKRIEEIAISLTEQFSVVETLGEIDSANKVHEIFSEMNYYKENPKDLRFINVPNDLWKRKSVMAILRGKKGNSKKTVIMIGHTDTVGVSDYGNLKDYANRPYELTEMFKEVSLPDDVKKDLESGDYLFGRGLFDMKTGDAIIMAIMEEISKNINEFEGNLIFCAVCDEEGNSGGMLSCIPELVRIKEEEQLDYLALLDTDYMTSEYEGDENKYVYVGTVGKLMPSFYIVGKETHVGEAFKGVDPNNISSEILKKINLNVDFCDKVEGEVSLPPVSLKQRDLKPEYSVQTAKTATLFFNYATHSSTPDEVLIKMKNAANEAFKNVIDSLNNQYKRYTELTNREYKKLPFEPRVLTYTQLYENVIKELGQKAKNHMEKFEQEMLKDNSIDQRDFSLKMVEELHRLWSDKDPVVIVYFTPPYYPHIYIEGKNKKETDLLDAVRDAVDDTKTKYNIVYKKFFPYISDLSYGSAPQDVEIINALKTIWRDLEVNIIYH